MNHFAPYELQFDEKKRKELIGEMLVLLREEKGYTQKKVADLLGVNSATYNGYEKGKTEPSAETIVRLSYLFDVPTDIILQKATLGTGNVDFSKEIKLFRERLAQQKTKAEKNENAENILKLIETMEKFADQIENQI